MALNELIQQLKEEMGWKKLPSPQPGVFHIPLGKNLLMQLSSTEEGIPFFYCVLGELPSHRQEEFLVHAMHANVMGQGTRGGVLSLLENGSQLTLTKTFDYTLEYRDFKEAVEDFITTVDVWKEELGNFGNRYGS